MEKTPPKRRLASRRKMQDLDMNQPPSPGRGSNDLQDAFKKYMEKKKSEKKELQRAVQVAAEKRKDPEFKKLLRQRFIEKARGYIGVPYARRFHPPEGCSCDGCTEAGRHLYADPLFLDCCGLVRRCVADLREDFGFKLGPGNQSYQFDTLPIRVGSVSELEPGDLVFYSGEYYSDKAKKQVFNMTHVEIFVGGPSGEAVIGSRERQKWVKEYPSYKFESKNWRLIEHHYCKIDTWLEGICEPSGLFEWSWTKTGSRPPSGLRKSIFASGSSQAAEGQAADGDD